jgi:PAS domain S-box-containing protein
LNLNKLFPRLTISAKLSIAFAVLTLLPLAIIAAFATPVAVQRLRRSAEASLAKDLELATSRVAGSIREAEQHLGFLVDAFIDSLLRQDGPAGGGREAALAATFLRSDTSAVLRVQAIDANGYLRFEASHLSFGSDAVPDESGGLYYLWIAENTAIGGRTLLPVEIRDSRAGISELTVVPAIAIVQPIRDTSGDLLGVAVAEASASALFGSLDAAQLTLEGTQGLVDQEGRFLYHSERKRDWSSLLPTQSDLSLHLEFPPSITEVMLSGGVGTARTPNGDIVSFRPVARSGDTNPRLVIYTTVPLTVIDGPVRDFLLAAGGIGVGILGLVLFLAVAAARQFTKPIYQLQRAARSLAAGGESTPLNVETKDELEDLAYDFTAMAATLVAHRRELETTVAARTRALELTRAELSDIVTHAADAIIGLDVDDRVRLWNQGAIRLFGYQEADAIGERIDDLIGFSDDSLEHENTYVQQSLDKSGSVVNLRTHRRPKDGDPFPVSLTRTSLTDASGRGVGSSLVIRDERMRNRLEEQMRRSERLAAASIMAAGLAHELNNPLAILGNRIELMKREVTRQTSDDQLAKDLAVLGQHVERLRGLTTDLLAFARDDHAERGPIALEESVGRVVRLLHRTFQTKGVELQFTHPEEVPTIIGNGNALETVFVNLLMNALQATPADGTVAAEILPPAGAPDFLRIAVRDTGSGVPPDARSRIFEPFFTTKGEDGGAGLGLTVCRSVVERHGGMIWIEDVEGGGSRFVVRLPVSRERA